MALPKTFTAGERLLAVDLNDNFEYLEDQGLSYGALEFVAASESAGNLTLDVDNGNRFSFTREMAGTETVAKPLNMPEGSVVTLVVDATNTGTSAPVVEARASGQTSTTDTTSHAITLPSGIQTGELLLVVFSSDGFPFISVSSGTNWNFLGQASNGTTVTGAIFWKIADGSDSLTVGTSVAEQSSHISFRISGVKKPGNVTGSNSNGSSTNSDPPSHTMPGTGNRGRLWIATRSGDAQVVATAAPSLYSNLQTIAATGSNGASTNTAERTVSSTAVTQNPGVFTSATEQWVSFTIGIDTTGSHQLNFSSDFIGATPDVRGSSAVQILRLPNDKYLAGNIRG